MTAGSFLMETYARVIVTVHHDAVDRPFTYRVPPALSLQVGSRVVVPFGGRRVTGYCVGTTTLPPEGEVKEIEQVLDEEALLTPELVELAEWGAERFLCRRLDFLHCMAPPSARRAVRKWVSLTGRREQEIAAPALLLLRENERVLLTDWLRRFPEIEKQGLLHSWQQSGIIKVIKEEHKVSRAKTIQVASLCGPGAMSGVTGQKQLLALKYLAEHNATPLSRLVEQGISYATLRRLAQKGLVRIAKLPVRRCPEIGCDEPYAPDMTLTEAQRQALAKIEAAMAGWTQSTVLLHGVTGSGKTEVYLQAIAAGLAKGLGSIMLVPEISLTPQMIDRFTARFGESVAVLHSGLSAGERYDEWCRVLTGSARVVVGARSAVFAPLDKIGLLIVDEEHEHSYKQEETPRYHAREVALWRARRHGGAVVLGSATPSLESYRLAEEGVYTLCLLPDRINDRPLPPVEIVDLRRELREGHRKLFSRPLLSALTETVAAGRQAILFLNRRAYATFVLCRECGFVLRCPNCQVALKFHVPGQELRCHYCEHRQPYPITCPACAGRYIRHFGTGTQRVEGELQKAFPEWRLARLDADTASRKGEQRRILSAFLKGEYQVLVGTQLVTKGLDFPNVTLVGVITADTALNLPDFRAGERTFQLLTQVAGRTGRGEAGGRVIVQTYAPDHYAVLAAKTHDFEGFYRQELKARKELGYPPFSRLVRFLLSGGREDDAACAAERLAVCLQSQVEVLGPAPCPLSPLRGRFRWQVVARDDSLERLLAAGREALAYYRGSTWADHVRLSVDIEPQNLL
jgi:primosomal protein N' (replication factor Y)